MIEVADKDAPVGKQLGDVSHESFLAHGDPDVIRQLPADEWNAIALNYTTSPGKLQKFVLGEQRRSDSTIAEGARHG